MRQKKYYMVSGQEQTLCQFLTFGIFKDSVGKVRKAVIDYGRFGKIFKVCIF